MKKCCITCAFCLKKITYDKGQFSITNENSINLTLDEAQNALEEDFNFLEKEKKYYDDWHREYNKRKEEKRKADIECEQILENYPLINSSALSIFQKQSRFRSQFNKTNEVTGKVYMKGDKTIYNDYKDLGITDPPPDDVKYTALVCKERHWGEIKSIDIEQKQEKLLKVSECEFYFPLTEKKIRILMLAKKKEKP